MKEKNSNKYILINRLTRTNLIEKGEEFWKILPNSYKEAKLICAYYFTNKVCTKANHLSPRRAVTRDCLMCEIKKSEKNNNLYYQNNKKSISEKNKRTYQLLKKDSRDARYNEETPEKRLKDILEALNTKKTLEEFIKKFDINISKKLENIESNRNYFIGQECTHAHQPAVWRIYGKTKTCYKCKLINDNIYRLKNKDELNLKKCLAYHKLDPERKKGRIKSATKWNQQNPELHKQSDEKWKKNNPIKRKEATKKDRKKHAARVNTHSAKYRADLLGATPEWLSEKAHEKIKEIQAKSKTIQNDTGIKQEVDHIFPLNGKNSCGLHVPWNLKVITLKENRKKGNNLLSKNEFLEKEEDRFEMIDENWYLKRLFKMSSIKNFLIFLELRENLILLFYKEIMSRRDFKILENIKRNNTD